MTFLNYLFQLLIVFVGTVHLMSPDETAKQETHKFRWTRNDDLNNTSCAIAIVPPRHPNTTLEVQIWSHQPNFIIFGAVAEGDRTATCRSNSSLFVLVGNPGIIWHPISDQCIHTKLVTTKADGGLLDAPIVDGTFKTLTTSYDCVHDHPNLALFKYDKNKPQRLTYLADVNMKTGKREEWCIRTYLDGTIQVHPVCHSPRFAYETFFHEFV